MDELLQQIKMAMESQMNCEVQVTGENEISLSVEQGDETKTYTMTIRED